MKTEARSRRRTIRYPQRLAAERLERRRLLAVTLTPHEQLLLELINRARAAPEAEAERLLLDDLNQGLEPGELPAGPRPPLAPHPILLEAARRHAQDMLDRDYFEHVNPERKGPYQRAEQLGYRWGGGENIAIGPDGGGSSDELAANVTALHAHLFWSPGHRANVLWEAFREVGPAVKVGEYTDATAAKTFDACMIVQNFGTGEPSHPMMDPEPAYLTGVAFSDAVVTDRFYSVGEGLSDVVVTATATAAGGGRFTTTTGPSGGYVLPLLDGTYSVRFSRDGQASTAVMVSIADRTNVKLDFDGVFSGPVPPSVPPADIALSAASIPENNVVGAVVGTLSAIDPDVEDTFTYTLVAGNGSADNAVFTIDGDRLKAATRFSFETRQAYSIRVRATDAGGLVTEKAFTITVTDVVDEPLVVEVVAPPAAGAYRAGQPVSFTVTLSEAVQVRGKPQIEVRAGGATRQATYVSGSGSAALTFQYVVGTKDNASSVALGQTFVLSRTNSITAGSETVPANLPAGIAGATAPGVRLDAAPPKVLGRVLVPDSGVSTVGQYLDFVVRFSEAVIVGGTPQIGLTGLTAARQATYVSGSGSQNVTFRYVVQAGDTFGRNKSLGLAKSIALPSGAVVTDEAGNRAALKISAPSMKGVRIDTATVAAATSVPIAGEGQQPTKRSARAVAFARLG